MPTTKGQKIKTAGNTGDALLRAAGELFALRGYHATAVRDIADAVEIRPAAVYHWFDSKEAILLQLQESFIAELTEAVVTAVDQQQDCAARMAAAIREHVIFHGLHAQEAFATDSEIRSLSPENRARIIAIRDVYQDRFIGLIEQGTHDGVFRVTDARIASYAILLECTGVAMWFDPRGSRSLEDIAAIHVELVLGSLGATPERIAQANEAVKARATS